MVPGEQEVCDNTVLVLDGKIADGLLTDDDWTYSNGSSGGFGPFVVLVLMILLMFGLSFLAGSLGYYLGAGMP